MLNVSGSNGLPLCISGIISSIPFPKQMADHDCRRKAVIKNLRSRPHSRSCGGETPTAAAAAARLRREMEEALSDLIAICYAAFLSLVSQKQHKSKRNCGTSFAC